MCVFLFFLVWFDLPFMALHPFILFHGCHSWQFKEIFCYDFTMVLHIHDCEIGSYMVAIWLTNIIFFIACTSMLSDQ